MSNSMIYIIKQLFNLLQLIYFLFSLSDKSRIDSLFEIYSSMPLGEEGEENFIYDQRKTNEGRPEGDFSQFYEELDKLLEEFGKAAEERRKSAVAHMPLAVSVPQLIRKVWY